MKSLGVLLFAFFCGCAASGQDPSSDLTALLTGAQRAQAAGDLPTAVADYSKAVRLRPDIAELRANLGLVQHEAAAYPDAIRSFQRALEIKPSLYVANLFLGIDCVRTGKSREAIPFLLKAEKLNSSDPLPVATLGEAWSSLGDYGAAAAAFQRALQIDPKRSSAWFGLGIAQLDTVERDARTLTGKETSSNYAKALFAESLVKQSRFKEAADTYRTILAAKDQPACMLSELALLAMRQGDTNGAQLQLKEEEKRHPECSLARLLEARLRIDAGDNRAALEILQELWGLDHGFLRANNALLTEADSPDRTQSWLAYLAQQQGGGGVGSDLYAALTDPPGEMQKGSSFPLHGGADATARAVQEYHSGHYALCADLLKPALSKGTALALRTLSACSFFTGDYVLTSEAARALANLTPNAQAEALYWSIKSNEKLAFASLLRYQQLEPDSMRSHILLGDIYRQRDRYADARKEYTRALDLSPGNTAALLGLASAYYGDAKMVDAVNTAQQALSQVPDDPDINLLMGEALVAQHNFTAAEPYLLKALNAKAQLLPHVHALLGEAYAEKGQTQDAIRELNLGVESDQDGSLHYQLARLYRKIGDPADSALALQRMKALQAKRLGHAAIAIQDNQPPSTDDSP